MSIGLRSMQRNGTVKADQMIKTPKNCLNQKPRLNSPKTMIAIATPNNTKLTQRKRPFHGSSSTNLCNAWTGFCSAMKFPLDGRAQEHGYQSGQVIETEPQVGVLRHRLYQKRTRGHQYQTGEERRPCAARNGNSRNKQGRYARRKQKSRQNRCQQ